MDHDALFLDAPSQIQRITNFFSWPTFGDETGWSLPPPRVVATRGTPVLLGHSAACMILIQNHESHDRRYLSCASINNRPMKLLNLSILMAFSAAIVCVPTLQRAKWHSSA
jgi:hypothetical protein